VHEIVTNENKEADKLLSYAAPIRTPCAHGMADWMRTGISQLLLPVDGDGCFVA